MGPAETVRRSTTPQSPTPFTGGDDVEPKWVSRAFDSVYSVAISEKAVYLGGHFAWNESPTAPDPWPGQDDIGYGTGQGLSAYALGDGVVTREHLGALNPATARPSSGIPARTPTRATRLWSSPRVA